MPLVVVAGPTGAGKTAAAIALAERFDGEIINADSMQVYRYLDIGTAKPGPIERARTPHHLLDVVDPDTVYSAGRFQRESRAAAADIGSRRRLPLLTGGTGLYIRACLEGLAEGGAAEPALRAALEAEAERFAAAGEPERLHARLAALDPESAARIHPNDLRRVVRAIEIFETTGVPASELRERAAPEPSLLRALYLVLDPGVEPLDTRIDARAEAMIQAGLLQEVRELRGRGYGPELRPLQAIGYRHLAPVVDGRDTLVNALAAMRRDTRRFARRQRTWFRAVREAVWFDPCDRAGIEKAVEEFLVEA